MQWYTFDELTPDSDKDIVIEIRDCNRAKFIIGKYRIGEGTASYKSWRYITRDEISKTMVT